MLEYKESNDASMELIENVIIKDNDNKKSEIDWDKLEEINPDIIGWIKIENTKINYNQALKEVFKMYNIPSDARYVELD